MEPGEITEAPWNRYQWTGSLLSLDGVHSTDFTLEDVLCVIAYSPPGSDWDTSTAAIIRLRDGRYAGWESTIGPTGSGFCQDAYGGDADILFARTMHVVKRNLSRASVETLKWFNLPIDDLLEDLTALYPEELDLEWLLLQKS